MLRLALCGLTKAHQGGCWAAWHVYATTALSGQHARVQQQGHLLLGGQDPWQQQQWAGLPHCLLQQHPYSQHNDPPRKPQPKQDSSSTSAGTAGDSNGSSNASSASSTRGSTTQQERSRSSNGTSSASSSSEGVPGGTKRAAETAASKGSSKKQYTGATTAADHIRRSTAAVSAQQLEAPARQQKQQLLPQSPPNLRQLPASTTRSSSAQLPAEQQPLQELVDQPPSLQSWEQESKHYTAAQQQQWQSQANYQKQPPQQQQYKIVQYSKGNSLTLALSAQQSGDYTLQKTKGVASAADLAAFRRTKPAKDGAAAAAKAAKEVPLLLRPLHPYYIGLKKSLQATFLPSGYPTSVGSNYLQYTLWQVRFLCTKPRGQSDRHRITTQHGGVVLFVYSINLVNAHGCQVEAIVVCMVDASRGPACILLMFPLERAGVGPSLALKPCHQQLHRHVLLACPHLWHECTRSAFLFRNVSVCRQLMAATSLPAGCLSHHSRP